MYVRHSKLDFSLARVRRSTLTNEFVLRGRLVYSNHFTGIGDDEEGEEYAHTRNQDNWELLVECLDGHWMGGAIYWKLEAAIAAVEKLFPTNFVRWTLE